MQLFPPGANTIAYLSLLALSALLGMAIAVLYMFTWSDYKTEVGFAWVQPVLFSHMHHVQGVGLDCRYCHAGVETSAFAGMPPTKTCMTCHSQIFARSQMLAPVRESFEKKTPIRWNKVQKLPEFVYFRHDVHIAKGVDCAACHGEIKKMPLTWQHRAFHMSECLECHRAPERFVKGRLVKPVDQSHLTDCSTCHR